jgi:hypothetical protein
VAVKHLLTAVAVLVLGLATAQLAVAEKKLRHKVWRRHEDWGVVLEDQCIAAINQCIHGEALVIDAVWGPPQVKRVYLRPDVEVVVVPYPNDGGVR